MVAKNGSAAPAKGAAPKKKAVAAEQEDDEPREPMGEEAKKTRLQGAIVAFNFGVMATIMGLQFIMPKMSMGMFMDAGAGILVGLVAAGITWAVMSR